MSIQVKDETLFILNTKHTSYAFFKDDEEVLVHLYWGSIIERPEDFDVKTMEGEQGYHPNLDKKREECSSFGCMRYKETSMKVSYHDGVRDVRYRIKGWKVEENHLAITLEDTHYPFAVTLHYVVHEEEDIIEKWREAENLGDQPIVLEKFFSGEYMLPGGGYKSINSNGTWADEFKWNEDTLNSGKKVYESLRGATAHVATPGFVIHRNATEDSGDVYFGVLAYSGNFKIVAEQTPYEYLNLQIGISDTDFSWNLNRGEVFTSPKVYAGYSSAGFGRMSNRLNEFSRNRVMPRSTAQKPLRVLYNSWEATTFDVTSEKQMELAKKAASLGAELFVVDDGWFGQRSSDHLGLGDWYVNQQKFPKGLAPLIECVKGLGMDFGIWIEPEMVNENSDLYRAHPDWIYRYATRPVLEGRYQYMLDLTNPEVVEYILHFIDELLSSNDISYIKWDMNRALGECASAHWEKEEFRSIWYRHVQGFYSIIRELRNRHPQVEFEACASGGGRVDYGCMEYFDEFWTSDNTDPLDRLFIQEFYSLLYPIKYMRAWITDAACNDSRKVPLSFKIHCAMCGSLGIGMDLNKTKEEEMVQLAQAVREYKEVRNVIQFGRLARLQSARTEDLHALQYDKDGEVVVFAFLMLRKRGKYDYLLKLKNLDENKVYELQMGEETIRKSGAYLMNHGINLTMTRDFSSVCLKLVHANGCE